MARIGEIDILSKVLMPKSEPELSNFHANIIFSISHLFLDQYLSIKEQAELTVSISLHGSFVDVGWTDQSLPVVYYHDFAVKVNDLGSCIDLIDNAMCPQAQKFDILIRIDTFSE